MTAETLWYECHAIALAGKLVEANIQNSYNFTGFYHWLTGKGETQYLPWEYFDKDYKNAQVLLLDLYVTNLKTIRNIARTLSINSSVQLDNPISVTMPELQSHNPWISAYTMRIFSSLNITILRTPDNYLVTVSALLQCYDRADFNPDDSFGPWGMFSDDTFIYLQQTGYACDFDEISQKFFTREFILKIKE